ncbi:hypothetical protein PtrEW4_007762 [Pyrenophora tritici-repentis]|nr:hypothetical protein Alg215_06677 [Pyrenophora tritici-repentis]KAI1566260.1 hypothetical protein PtrEW4_007762 [Pyrenophora tritici-repentis]KAI1577354.1 hypothetical protein PtrEW7m1_005926 [Pyrenophora tritici-repentis]
MLFTALQFAALTAAAAVIDSTINFGPFCGTPAPVYANGTKASNWPAYIAELEATSSFGGGKGATDAWGNNGGPIPWPRDGNNQVIIPYCFTEEFDRKNVRSVVENTMAKWIEYLGGPAGSDTRHALSFQERKNNQGKPLYCSTGGDCNTWNLAVPQDTVAIEYTEGTSWGASMAHEHNRPDRDTYIRVDYHRLADWPDCWNRARSAEGDRITEDGLCLDMYHAIKYGYSCSAYIINLVEPGWPITSMIGYALSSIMHYPSVNGDATEECRMNGDGCALEE